MAISTIGGSSSSGGGQPYEQVFLSSGTWTKPAGVKTVEVICAGAGGSSSYGGSYGGGGGYYRGYFDVTSVANVTVTVGAGTMNGNGGNSSFGNFVVATGGIGPTNASYYAGNSGGWYLPTVPGTGYLDINTNSNATSNFHGSSTISSDGTGAIVSNGSYILAINNSGVVKKSTDGVTWTNVGTTPNSQGVAQTKLAWGANLWIAVANGSTNYATSPDGVTWTARAIPAALGSGARTISYANGRWFMSGQTQDSIVYSTDGLTWTSGTINRSNQPMNAGRVAYGLGVYMMIPSSDGWNRLFYSSDGITWNFYTTYQIAATNDYADIGFQGGYFFALAGNTGSSNFWRWTDITNISNYGPGYNDTFTYGGGVIFQSTGQNATARYSVDNGYSWTTFQSSYYVRGVYHNGKFFVYRIQMSAPEYNYLAGYAGFKGFIGGSSGSSSYAHLAGGAGGPGGYNYSSQGARPHTVNGVDGWCNGGSDFQTGADGMGLPGCGGGSNNRSKDGAVIVRWWA